MLLPISRVLVRSNLGAGPLLFAAKLAYLRAAIETVPLRGVRPNVSRLSVATGMTRKEVSSLLRNAGAGHGAVSNIGPDQRAFRVVRGWMSDPRFKTRSGRPAQLRLRGGPADFSALVRTYGGDVTLASVLAELERTKAVEVNEHGRVRLRSKSRLGAPSLAGMSEFARLLSDFTDTTSRMIGDKRHPLFFGFTECLLDREEHAALFQRTFARRAAALLASVNEWRARRLALPKPPVRKQHPSRARVGLGVYLVHNEHPKTTGFRNKQVRK